MKRPSRCSLSRTAGEGRGEGLGGPLSHSRPLIPSFSPDGGEGVIRGAWLVPALLFLLLLGAPPAAATPLTLDDALRLALEQNRDILKAREYRNLVLGRYVEERSAAFPRLTLAGSAGRSRDYSSRALTGVDPLRYENAAADANVAWTVFAWGQLGAALRAAREGMADAEDQLALQRQTVVREVTAAFHDCLLARELSGIARDNLDRRQRHFEEATRKFNAGVATEYDVLAAGVAVDNARPEMIRSDNFVRMTRERLRFLLAGDTTGSEISGSLVAPLIPPPTYEEALATALAERRELAGMRHQLNIQRELIAIANAGDKPRVELRSGYGWHSLAYGEADADARAWNGGVYLTYPIFDGLRTRGQVAQAESGLATLTLADAQLRDAIAVEIRDAVNAVEEATAIVRSLNETVAQAERLLGMAEKGYAAGVKTRLEVDDAQLNLTVAKGNLSRARRDYLVARITLDLAMGVIIVPAVTPEKVGTLTPFQ